MPATFEILSRETGRVLFTQTNVLDPLRLSGCTMASGSSVLTVPSTEGLHPGMGVACAGIPKGSFIACIIDDNKVKLMASFLNPATNKWETTEEAAEATATISSPGRVAIFSGHPVWPVATLFSRGPYRDEFEPTQVSQSWVQNPVLGNPPVMASAAIANGYLDEGATLAATTPKSRLGDPEAHVPHRHLTESWSEWLFVCTGGHVAHVLANPDLHAVRMKEYTAPTP